MNVKVETPSEHTKTNHVLCASIVFHCIVEQAKCEEKSAATHQRTCREDPGPIP